MIIHDIVVTTKSCHYLGHKTAHVVVLLRLDLDPAGKLIFSVMPPNYVGGCWYVIVMYLYALIIVHDVMSPILIARLVCQSHVVPTREIHP